MNTKTVVGIVVSIVLILVAVWLALFYIYPYMMNGTAKVRYITDGSHGVAFGGNVKIYIDGQPATNGESSTSLPQKSNGIYPADQYISFKLPVGTHKIEIRHLSGTLLASMDAKISADTTTIIDMTSE